MPRHLDVFGDGEVGIDPPVLGRQSQAAACACTEPACHEAQATALRGVLAEVPAEATLGDAGAVRYGRAVLGAVQCIYAMTDDERAAIGELAAMRDKVCACRDHNCVAVMEDGLDRFGDDFDARLHSTGSLRREGELSRELMDCLSNLDDGDWDDGDGDGPDGFSEGGEGWPEGEENGDPGDD